MSLRIGALDLLASPPRILLANSYAWRAGETTGPHYDESVLITVVDSGRGRIAIGTRSFACQRGQVLHAPWASPMHYASDAHEPLAMTSLHLAFRPWSEPTPPTMPITRPAQASRRCMTGRPGAQPWDDAFAVQDRGDLRELARRAVSAWSARSRRHLLLRGIAAEIVDALAAARDSAIPADTHPHAAAVRRIATWMEVHISRHVSRAELVARSGLDATTLTQAFRAVFGRSPTDWLIDARLREARALLRTTEEPIGRVGLRVGIADPFYFSKLFKRRVGVSPQRYRAGEG
ncbi:MAG TPA: AraC family transcriptional regulator [Planctomycetota bacterium]|nr:AraC family transcriptional regulator [Planctomycetota bacterium]